MPKTLQLSLKKNWFDMIKAGIKKEEYREIKPTYLAKFCTTIRGFESNHSNNFDVSFHLKWPEEVEYDTLVFTLAYPSKSQTDKWLTFKNPKIRIGKGRPEWGAEPDKLYFVITWEN